MNELSEIDKELLNTIKRNIETKAGLKSEHLSQKDYDFLQYYIEEFTGEVLSLTTIKRIWKNDFQRLPHLSTLDILSKLAFDQDWHTLKRQFVESKGELRNVISTEGISTPKSEATTQRTRVRVKLVAAAGMLVLGVLALYYLPSMAPIDASNVKFSAVPTVDFRIPNSVVFTYDVAGCRANHFYIQQSWDPARKVEVSALNQTQTDIYYEPGYHYAKLMADDRVLKEIPVHIRYDDWYVRVRYPDSQLAKVGDADLLTDGYLGLRNVFAKKLSGEETFQLGYMLSRDFDLSADELQLKASIRFDSTNVLPCPSMNLLIKGAEGYSWITMGTRGCESNFGFSFSDMHVNGKTNDLSQMALESLSWQEIRVVATNGKYQLYVNNKVVLEGTYQKKLGELKEVDFFFNGIGSIDDINISDSQNKSFLSQNFN
jgi:hypothetical protein